MSLRRFGVVFVVFGLLFGGTVLVAGAADTAKKLKVTGSNVSSYSISGLTLGSRMYLGENPKSLAVTISHSKEATDLAHADFYVFVSCRSTVEGDTDYESEGFSNRDVTVSAKRKATYKINIAREFGNQFSGSFDCDARVEATLGYDFDDYDYPVRPPERLTAKKLTLVGVVK